MFGLDISDASIEVLELKKSFGRVKLVGYGRAELPEGIVRDGIVLKKKELSEAIKKILSGAKPKAIKSREVILSLPESRVFTHVFRFPANLNLKQIAHVLQFEVPNVLPISLGEVYADFLPLGKVDNEQEVFFVAVPRKVVDDLSEVLKNAGLKPKVFDMESASFARAIGKEAYDGALVVDIGARTTIISIFDRNGIRFTTNIGIAGNLFTETIAKKLKIKWQEAEKLKIKCGLSPDGKLCEGGQIFLILQSAMQPILQEIRKVIKFYEEKSGRKIKKIILCGGSAMMPNIANYFEENLGLKVSVGRPEAAKNLEVPKEKITPLFLNVFGLALCGISEKPESVGINLIFDFEKLTEAKLKSKKKLAKYLIGAAVLAVLGVGIFATLKLLPKFAGPKIVPISFETEITVPDQGRILEITKEISKTFPTQGERIVEGRSQGKVKIYNKTSTPQTLVADSRLLKDDILFRLKEEVTIPSGGVIEAEIYADQVGAAGDVTPGIFVFPGLSTFLQTLIYAESEEPTSGGAVTVKIVSQEDIEKAKEEIAKEAEEIAKSEVEGMLESGELLWPEVLEKEILETKVEPGQDKIADEFNLQMAIKFKFLTVFENELKSKARTELSKQGIKKVESYQISQIDFSLVNFDAASGRAGIRLSAKAVKK